jgi:hypothetical protein
MVKTSCLGILKVKYIVSIGLCITLLSLIDLMLLPPYCLVCSDISHWSEVGGRQNKQRQQAARQQKKRAHRACTETLCIHRFWSEFAGRPDLEDQMYTPGRPPETLNVECHREAICFSAFCFYWREKIPPTKSTNKLQLNSLFLLNSTSFRATHGRLTTAPRPH